MQRLTDDNLTFSRLKTSAMKIKQVALFLVPSDSDTVFGLRKRLKPCKKWACFIGKTS